MGRGPSPISFFHVLCKSRSARGEGSVAQGFFVAFLRRFYLLFLLASRFERGMGPEPLGRACPSAPFDFMHTIRPDSPTPQGPLSPYVKTHPWMAARPLEG